VSSEIKGLTKIGGKIVYQRALSHDKWNLTRVIIKLPQVTIEIPASLVLSAVVVSICEREPSSDDEHRDVIIGKLIRFILGIRRQSLNHPKPDRAGDSTRAQGNLVRNIANICD
jgi:hypothetical protein